MFRLVGRGVREQVPSIPSVFKAAKCSVSVEEKTLLYSQKKDAWPNVCLSLSSKETSLNS